MTIVESLPYGLFCMAVVFGVLIALFLIIKIFSLLIGLFTPTITANQKEARDLQMTGAPRAEIQNSSGELKLYNVDEPTAAMIMAIVSDETDIPLDELCFKSIKAKN